MDQLLVVTENRNCDKAMQSVLDGVVRNYFTDLIKTGSVDNYSDIVIDLLIDNDKEILCSINRVTKERKDVLAEIQYTEKTFVVISKFLGNENIISSSFIICLN